MYHFVPGLLDRPNFAPCNPNCPFSSVLLSRGDSSGITITGKHLSAERCRADRARLQTCPPVASAPCRLAAEQLDLLATRWKST